jgi:hypothetical protein
MDGETKGAGWSSLWNRVRAVNYAYDDGAADDAASDWKD